MLDRSLPFGEVHGLENGVKYYQHDGQKGRHYNAEGYEVDLKSGERIEKIEPPVKKMKPITNKKAAAAQPPDDEDQGDDSGDIVVNGVNLSAFARGEASDVPAGKIKKAVEDHFGRKPKDLAEALKIVKGEEIE